MSLLPGNLSGSANDLSPWTRSLPSPLDPHARHLHADEPRRRPVASEISPHHRSEQVGQGIGLSTRLATAAGDIL